MVNILSVPARKISEYFPGEEVLIVKKLRRAAEKRPSISPYSSIVHKYQGSPHHQQIKTNHNAFSSDNLICRYVTKQTDEY